MSDAPERVWLDPDIMPSEHWKQYLCDVGYIRADLHDAVTAERDALKSEVERLREALAAAEESIVDFIGVHNYPKDSGAYDVLWQVRAALGDTGDDT